MRKITSFGRKRGKKLFKLTSHAYIISIIADGIESAQISHSFYPTFIKRNFSLKLINPKY